MKYGKENLEKMVFEIIEEKISDSLKEQENELHEKIRQCNNSTEVLTALMVSFYTHGILNTKTIIVETLYKILNEGKLGE